MKTIIRKKLSLIILMAMLLSLLFNYAIQIRGARRDMLLTSQELFWQIHQILEQNAAETGQIERDFKASCLVRAKAAAYIVQSRPEIVGDQPEMEKVAALLEVDEFHLFDPQGTLYAGSQPKYFGLNFRSGTQMQFFLPMLSDRSLELCQDITPNTAEQKLMQYAAVWREDGNGIVQIGMEPGRVLEAKKKNELSYIFSLLTADSGAAIYAIDPETYRILGSTNRALVGRRIDEIGIDPQKISAGRGMRAVVDGIESYCAFDPSDSVILARTRTIDRLYQNVNKDCLLLALYLALVAVILIFAISKCLDIYIIDGISAVNRKLLAITGGDLDATVEVQTTPEFVELSSHINSMVKSLLDVTGKLSAILEIARVPIGVYEYSQGMKRVLATSRVAGILRLTEEEAERILSDYALFEGVLDGIRRHPADQSKEIYELPGQAGRYVRMESFVREHSILGIVIDVTEDMMEKQRIEYERDVDQLTGLYNRRAFYCRAELLFLDPAQLGHAALLMVDSDDLKQVNDRYGHENGDRYLRGVADILRSCRAENKLLARLSGDEFVLLIYGCPSRETLTDLIDDLDRAMAGFTVELSSQIRIPVRFSVGCAFYPEEPGDFGALLKLADERMYQNKKRLKRPHEENQT